MPIREAFELVSSDSRLIPELGVRRKDSESRRAELLPAILVEAEWGVVQHAPPDIAEWLIRAEEARDLHYPQTVDVHRADDMQAASAVFVADLLSVLTVCGRVGSGSRADTYVHLDDPDLSGHVVWHPGLLPGSVSEERLSGWRTVLSRLYVRTAWYAIGL